jgi:hypothetical protein
MICLLIELGDKNMLNKQKLMQPLHIVVPGETREAIVRAARAEGVSIGEIARDLLSEGMRARGLMA